jgi:hypothetical protein
MESVRAQLFDGARGGCYKLVLSFFTCGAVAQLGARIDGIDEVAGSNPAGSTKFSKQILPNKICGIFFRRYRVCNRNPTSARTTSSKQQKSRRDAGATKGRVSAAVVRSFEPAIAYREEDCAVVAWIVVAEAGAGEVRDVGF